jgi:hypothetical protein
MIAGLLEGVLTTPTLFSLTCGAIYVVLWFNMHYENRIAEWAAYGWNGELNKKTHPPAAFLIWPRGLVNFLFSPKRIGPGRYLGRFFSRLFYPVLAMSLLAGAILYIAWIPTSEVLFRMRQHPAVLKTNADGSHSFDFYTRHVVNTGILLSEHESYVVEQTSSPTKAMSDGGISAQLTGIPTTKKEARARGIADSEITTPLMRLTSFACRDRTAKYFQLCVCIGGPSSSTHPITPGVPFTSHANGILYVFVNDIPGFYGNNEGEVQLTVKRIVGSKNEP